LIYIVLGMHKSGTTLVSQMLHHSGINMGEFDENVHYDKGNKYERESSFQLDLELLGTTSDAVLDLVGGGLPPLSEVQRQRMQAIIAEGADTGGDWGIKDPRMCLTYERWREELPPHKIIFVFRDPAQVWPRYKWLGKRKYVTNFNRAYSYLHRWQEHNRNVLRYLDQGPQERIVLDYHELMVGDVEFGRLQTFVDRPLEDRRQKELYRSKAGQDIFLRFADGLLARRTGCSTRDTMRELRDFRAREIG